jgi:hypothetical protein
MMTTLTRDIPAGSSPRNTHQNLGISSGDTRDKDGARHLDIMIQVYRLLEYNNLVTDLQQPKRQSDTTVGGVLKQLLKQCVTSQLT